MPSPVEQVRLDVVSFLRIFPHRVLCNTSLWRILAMSLRLCIFDALYNACFQPRRYMACTQAWVIAMVTQRDIFSFHFSSQSTAVFVYLLLVLLWSDHLNGQHSSIYWTLLGLYCWAFIIQSRYWMAHGIYMFCIARNGRWNETFYLATGKSRLLPGNFNRSIRINLSLLYVIFMGFA